MLLVLTRLGLLSTGGPKNGTVVNEGALGQNGKELRWKWGMEKRMENWKGTR